MAPHPQVPALDSGCCSPVLSPIPHICLTQLWLSLSPCLPPAPLNRLLLSLCLELIPGVINYQFMSNLKFIIHFSHKLPKVLSRGQDEGERQASALQPRR